MVDASLTELLPRLFISMAVVIAVMWVAARLLKGRQIPGTGGMRLKTTNTKRREEIEIIARHGLGRHSSLAVVRTGNKALVLGITENQISVLTELDEQSLVASAQIEQVEVQRTDIDINATPALEPAWTGLLSQVRERTVRR